MPVVTASGGREVGGGGIPKFPGCKWNLPGDLLARLAAGMFTYILEKTNNNNNKQTKTAKGWQYVELDFK